MQTPWKLENQRTYFSKALVELGRSNPKVVVVGADTTESVKTMSFGKEFPGRLFNVGIAEQNMMGIAAGLAAAGQTPYACTYSVFGTAQVYNVIRQAIAYPSLNVKIFCSHAGLTTGPDGATHQMNEDIALMRGLPNMTVLVPADAPETGRAVLAAADWDGPVYCRFSRANFPTVTRPEDPFEIGRAVVMRDGSDVTLVGCGIMVSRCLLAAEELAKVGLQARVLNVHTVKPLDAAAVIKAARETGAIVTAEEHSIVHGMGSAVAAVTAEHYPVPVQMVGVRDVFGESGEAEELLEKYGLTAAEIARAAHLALKLK
ncbi:MAG TPA: transketolase C-terminal domain-containing protein [Thermoplasmata archaeon]|nr:transketolase C-terminal domain-containing protein [Thermoplasmata archaeon]